MLSALSNDGCRALDLALSPDSQQAPAGNMGQFKGLAACKSKRDMHDMCDPSLAVPWLALALSMHRALSDLQESSL